VVSKYLILATLVIVVASVPVSAQIPTVLPSSLSQRILLTTGSLDIREELSISGENPDVGNQVDETVWTFGGIRPEVSSVQCLLGDGACTLTMTAFSDDAGDDSAGIGARTILVRGIDINGLQFFESVDMNGTIGTAMSTAVRAIISLGVSTVGSNNAQVGIITLQNAATIYEGISLDDGTTLEAYGNSHTAGFDVPVGFVAGLLRMLIRC